jgi:hypothetical protein
MITECVWTLIFQDSWNQKFKTSCGTNHNFYLDENVDVFYRVDPKEDAGPYCRYCGNKIRN